jgi:hypothetical protein
VPRPPLLLLAAYRLFAWRLGPAYQEWTYADITRRGYTLRQAVPVGVVVGMLLAVVSSLTGSDPRRAVLPVVGVVVIAFFLRKALRERALRQQGLSPAGDADADWFSDDALRTRRNIVGAVLTTLLVLGAAVLLGARQS